ncbi:MAG TPA: hypothetical protein DCZ37_00440, partial [Alteromonas macleodii]|nr:hypothetical protein [Alteromonas macleodii]
HTQAREALNHYRDSVREQREHEQRRYERDVQGLQSEVAELEQTLTARQHSYSELTQRNTQLETQLAELKRHYDAVYQESRSSEARLSELKQQYDRLEARFAGVTSELQGAHDKQESLQTSLTELTKEKQALKHESVQLNAVIETQKAMIEQWFNTKTPQKPRPS